MYLRSSMGVSRSHLILKNHTHGAPCGPWPSPLTADRLVRAARLWPLASARQAASAQYVSVVPLASKFFFRTTLGRVVGGDRRIPSYGGEYRYAREDKDVDVRLLLFESFGGFGKGVGEILWGAANVLQNKLTRAQYLDEVTWTTKSWLGLQKQRISVVLHTAIAEQVVNELASGEGGRVHGAKLLVAEFFLSLSKLL